MGAISTVATLNTVFMRSLSNVAYVLSPHLPNTPGKRVAGMGCVCRKRGLIAAQSNERGDCSRLMETLGSHHWCSHVLQPLQTL